MAWYRTGSIALTNGSATVAGTGTDFINGAAIGEGVLAPDGKTYEILTIASATSLTLGSVYLGATASGQTYSIVPTQSYIRDLASQAATLVNSYATVNNTALTTGATTKTTPVDADSVGLKDSVTGFARLLTWANLKATLLTWLQGTVFPSPGAIGGTTPAAGSFTTLNASGNITGNALIKFGGFSSHLDDYALYANSPDGTIVSSYSTTPVTIRTGNATRGVFSSTGLAVTGALSATGSSNLMGGLSINDTQIAAFGSWSSIQENGFYDAASNVLFNAIKTSGSNDTWQYRFSASASRIKQLAGSIRLQTAASGTAGADITWNDTAVISTTGLAVTGALSATTTGADNSLRITRTSFADAVVYAGGANASFGTVNNYPVTVVVNNSNVATFDTSGNFGLGVTPSAWAAGIKSFDISGGALVAVAGTTELHSNSYFGSSNIYKATGFAAKYAINNAAGTHIWYTAPSGTAGDPITFTQAMSLDASGNLLVGTTSRGHVGGIDSIDLDKTDAAVYITHSTGTPSGNYFASFGYVTTSIGSITQSGTTAVAYNTTSDHRLKTNVRPANAARFGDIQFVDFEWVDGRHDCGVIADQLQSVYPDLVLGAKDATEVRTVEITPEVKDDEGNVVTPAVTEDQTFPVYQQVNYMGLIGRMGTVIQQQSKLIAAMEARLTAAGL